jgi:hypothetical protein
VVGVLNQVRREAGLGAVVYNADESATASRLAPHYFASLNGGVPEIVADRITLGLRAGWQIPGMVGYGHLTSALIRNTKDATALLVSALNRPSGRETLLAPDVKVVAVGPVLSKEQSALGAVFTSYSLLDPAQPGEVAEVLAALNSKRRERGLAPAVLVDSLQPGVTAAARAVELGQMSPEGGLQQVLDQGASAFGAAEAWILAADAVERLPFPERLFLPSPPSIAIGVAHFRPPGSPWGAHGALIVSASSVATTAAAPPLPGKPTRVAKN